MFPIDIDFSRLLEAFKYNPDAPMIFSSGIFLWLFAAFMVIYTLLQHRNTVRILLLLFSPIIFITRVVEPIFSCWLSLLLPIL